MALVLYKLLSLIQQLKILSSEFFIKLLLKFLERFVSVDD
jgi:hypothetical protein